MGQAETRPNPGSSAEPRAQERHCLRYNGKLWYLERWKHQTSVGKGGGALRLCVCNVILTALPVSPSCQTWRMETCPRAPGGASFYQVLSEATCPARDLCRDRHRRARDAELSPSNWWRYFFSSSYTRTGNGSYCAKTGTAVKTHARTHWTSAPSTVNTSVYVTLPPHHLPKQSVLIKVLLWSTVTKIAGKMHPAEPTDRKTAWIFLFSSCGYDNRVFDLLVCCKYPSLVCLKTRINFMILI